MRISWKWLSEMVDVSRLGGSEGGKPAALADLLTRRGIEVEEIHPLAEGFDKVVAVKILERNPHPQADRLSLCRVTTGQGEPLEIVCGAQNMKAGDIVALAQIGAQLPNGLKITQSKIRGVVSNGMLCSEEELKLKESSEGILILPPSTPLGLPLAEILGLDDTVLVLKLTPNRGDCLSHWGIAREVAAATGQKLKRNSGSVPTSPSPISVSLDAGESAPQFWGCFLEGVEVGPSPDWLVRRLEALGSRSINNVVDATNLVMLELGHPVHAYDADRIEGEEIHVRMSNKEEELPLLDGSSIKLNGDELVIADRNRAVGLAGVMGGGNSEVQQGTTRVFLECAEFAAPLVRKAASSHQKRTDASYRFERGIDPMGLQDVMLRLVELVSQLAGGRIVGSVVSRLPSRDPAKAYQPRKVSVTPEYFSKTLGTQLQESEIQKVLADLNCQVEKHGSDWSVIVPSYRNDLHIKQDLVEEVARSIGYDRIPSTVPPLTSAPTSTAANPEGLRLEQIHKAKQLLSESGLNETVNYSFTSQRWLENFGIQSNIRIKNPLSEEHEVMVPTLLPGMVRNALDNWNHHFGSEPLAIRLFEVRPTFQISSEPASPGSHRTGFDEKWKIAVALSGPRYADGLRAERGEVDFYDLKGIIDNFFEKLGVRGVRMLPMTASRNPGPTSHLFHPGQSVEILAGNQIAGASGLMHPAKAKALKLRAPLWIAELDWEAVSKVSKSANQARSFKPWGEFPGIERDFALLVKEDITSDRITQSALKAGKPLARSARIFDIYRGPQVPKGMTSIAVRVIFSEEKRSLQEEEADSASTRILDAWKKELGAELRG